MVTIFNFFFSLCWNKYYIFIKKYSMKIWFSKWRPVVTVFFFLLSLPSPSSLFFQPLISRTLAFQLLYCCNMYKLDGSEIARCGAGIFSPSPWELMISSPSVIAGCWNIHIYMKFYIRFVFFFITQSVSV